MPGTKKSPVRFKDRAELLEFFLEVTAVTSETLDLDLLMERVAEIVRKVIPYQLFAILLYSERLKGLRIRYAIGHRPEVVKNLVIPIGEGITGAAAASRDPVLVADVRADPRYLNALDAVRSELAVPMMARNRLVGVLDVQSTKAGAFTGYERSLLKLVSSRVAFAIDNARLYHRVDRQNRTLQTLARVSQEISSILDLDDLLRKIAETMRELINYDAFSIYLLDEEQKLLRHRFSVRYDQHVEADNIPFGKGITGAAAESRQPVAVADTMADPRYIALHADVRSEVAVPLIVQDKVIGVLDLESDRIGYYTEDHVRTLSMLAPQIAISVENARLYEEVALRERRMEDDLKAARKLQSLLLQGEPPEIPGLDIGFGLRPAREISGDLYDFFEYGGEHAVIAFGDSSGKGAAAALYGAMVSGLLRTMAPRRRGPAMLLQALNEKLMERRVDAHYVTLLVLLWQAQSRRLTLANAGATPPVLCRRGKTMPLKVEGVPIGLLGDRSYDEVIVETEPGDVILLFSDGIAEASNAADDQFGRECLERALRKSCGLKAQAIADQMFAAADRFTKGAPPADDQTVIALKVL